MSTPITISLLCNGKQKDYKAVFTDDHASLQFTVMVDDKAVCFEGTLEDSFQIKKKDADAKNKQLDPVLLEAINQQLNQIFF